LFECIEQVFTGGFRLCFNVGCSRSAQKTWRETFEISPLA